jgi:hypothetical protein
MADNEELLMAVIGSFYNLADTVRVTHDPIRPYLMQYLGRMMGDVENADLTVTWPVARAAAQDFLANASDAFFADEQVKADAQDSYLLSFEDGTVLYCEPRRLTELRPRIKADSLPT